MRITFDPTKREWTLRNREVDFKDAASVFDGPTIDVPDLRQDYGELRVLTAGLLSRSNGHLDLDPTGRRATHHLDEEGQ